jgi:photosystem II stability/assembly factor-like uncharacterized protein
VFAGTLTRNGAGGVFRSLDGGVTWQPSRAGLANLPLSVVVTVPDATGTILAGGDTELDRSVDRGQSWQVLAHPDTGPNSNAFSALLVEPLDPDTIYAGLQFGFGDTRVFRSENGGASWTPTARLLSRVEALRADPRRARALWAAGGDGLEHSDDGGAHWDAAPLPKETFLDVRDLAIDGRTPLVLWLAGSGSRHQAARLYRSADGGQTWVRRDTGIAGTSVASIALDPSSPDVVYAAMDTGLYRSGNAGATWAKVQGIGAPVSRVLVAPTSPSTLWAIAGPKREPRRSRDGGATWERPLRGLDGAPVLDLAFDPLDPGRVYAATATRSMLVWSD